MTKRTLVTLIDIILFVLVSSMVVFIKDIVVISVMMVVMFLVVDHYLVMRGCYLESGDETL